MNAVRPGGRADVYLHIGLPKSGTTHLQHLLWGSRQSLADRGVLVPGDKRLSHQRAVWDLMGRRPRGAELPQVVGSWQRLVDEVRGWQGSHAIVSEEFLAFARARQVRRAVRAFAPAQVHVVVTIRDLARVLVGAWQQQMAKGQTWSWEEYVATVRDPKSGPASAGVAFWLRQDVVRVLDTWESEIPRERVHLVTVPPAGAPPELLVERFATATHLDPGWLESGKPLANVSVGAVEAEVLRRLNVLLGGRLNERQYTRVVTQGVRPVLQERRHPLRMGLPEEHRGWVSERAGAMVDELRRRDLDVVGDLDDLLPGPGGADTIRPDAVQPAELAEAAMAALGAVTERYARFWWRARGRKQQESAGPRARLASSARVAGARARLAALGLMDRSRLARRLAIRYLNRSARTQPPPGSGSLQ